MKRKGSAKIGMVESPSINFLGKEFTKKNIYRLPFEITQYKSHNNGTRYVLSDTEQDLLSFVVGEVASHDKEMSQRQLQNVECLVTLSHIIEPSNIRKSIQCETLTTIINKESLNGLKWFLAIGFDPSSRSEDNINPLEFLAEKSCASPTNPLHLEMAKMLIGAKKSTENLARSRGNGLRVRTTEGKDLEGLEGNLSNLVIFALEKNIIQLSEFAPSRNIVSGSLSSFEKTLENIFSNEERTSHLLERYKAQSGVKITKEHLSHILPERPALEDNFVRPFTFEGDDLGKALSSMHIESSLASTTLRRRKASTETKYSEIIPNNISENQDTDVSPLIPAKGKGAKTQGCIVM